MSMIAAQAQVRRRSMVGVFASGAIAGLLGGAIWSPRQPKPAPQNSISIESPGADKANAGRHAIDVAFETMKGDQATLLFFEREAVSQHLTADGSISVSIENASYGAAQDYTFMLLDSVRPRVMFTIKGEDLLKLKDIKVDLWGDLDSLESVHFTPNVSARVIPLWKTEAPQ